MIEARDGLFTAVPLDVYADPAKTAYVLDRLVEHESEWSDFQQDVAARKRVAAAMLAAPLNNPAVAILEVWCLGAEAGVVGLLGFTEIVPQVDAQFHPVFFDGKMRNLLGKRELLLRAMDWAFQTYHLHRLSMQLPETAFALVDFAREKLGFRFEAENRTIKQRRVVPYGHHKKREVVALTPRRAEAEWGSRLHQRLHKGGRWLDMLLLSVTAEEFGAFVREDLCRSSLTAPTPSRPSPATCSDSASKSSEG